jgi:uncharacterized protein YyaL (SSP411 family)
MIAAPRLALATIVLLSGCARGSVSGATESATPGTTSLSAPDGPVQWAQWEPAAFSRAAADNRIILINVVATWCHWCHVMEETTYADPEVARLLRTHFTTIRVDSDARPDIAERYRAWGWPATAVLTPDARPVTELRGYENPATFAEFLRGLVAERDAGTLRRRGPQQPDHPARATDVARVRDRVATQMDTFWDEAQAGWGQRQKYPWPAPIEFSLLRARLRASEADSHARALRTLEAERDLLDPVWGGMYQYSVGGGWDDPHFEKITMIQAGAIETYALAARATNDASWLDPAHEVSRYMLDIMQDANGGFFTSQDADLRRPDGATVLGAEYYALDDAGRRVAGMPRIDTAVYADLNGLMITALCELWRADGDDASLAAAVRAGERLLRTHRVADSGAFHHGADDDRDGLLYLADQAAMGRALVALYTVTADVRWLDAAERVGRFMLGALEAPDGGFFAHTADPAAVGVFAQRRRPVEENGQAARFLVELHHRLDGDTTVETPYLEAARRTVLAVGVTPNLPREGKVVGRLLLAADLVAAKHLDVTVVGRRADASTEPLWRAALRWYEPRANVELDAPGRRYPDIGRPAVYLCTDTACSTPIDDPEALAERADAFVRDNFDAP